jgi:hypothetical protein
LRKLERQERRERMIAEGHYNYNPHAEAIQHLRRKNA